MSTLAQMRSRIADDLDRDDINTQIDKAINRAIEFYAKKERFWFNEVTASFNTVASQFNYSSSDTGISNIREIDYVKIAIASTLNFDLTPRTYKYVQDSNVGNYTSQPTDYAYYKENFFIYPVPNAVYAITVSYTKSYTALSLDADTNDFTSNAEDLIEARASWWLYRRILKDYDAAADSKEEELEALQGLRIETARMISTGRVVPTEF